VLSPEINSGLKDAASPRLLGKLSNSFSVLAGELGKLISSGSFNDVICSPSVV
jgi:hypothetical protein